MVLWGDALRQSRSKPIPAPAAKSGEHPRGVELPSRGRQEAVFCLLCLACAPKPRRWCRAPGRGGLLESRFSSFAYSFFSFTKSGVSQRQEPAAPFSSFEISIPDTGGVLVLLNRLRLRNRDFCKKEKLLWGGSGISFKKQLLVELLIPECPLDE